MEDDAALRRTIDELYSRAEILEIGARYARAVDRLDRVLLKACFHPDSQHNHGGFEGESWDFCNMAIGTLRELEHTQHHIGTRSVTVDGDRASGEPSFLAYHQIGEAGWTAWPWAGAGDVVIIGGRYLDRYERRDGQWRISYRRGVHEWEGCTRPLRRGAPLSGDQVGNRDHSDPVYLWHQHVLAGMNQMSSSADESTKGRDGFSNLSAQSGPSPHPVAGWAGSRGIETQHCKPPVAELPGTTATWR